MWGIESKKIDVLAEIIQGKIMREIFSKNALAVSILGALTGMVCFSSSVYADLIVGNKFESGYADYIYGKYDDSNPSSGISGHRLDVSGGKHYRLYAAFSVLGSTKNNILNILRFNLPRTNIQ